MFLSTSKFGPIQLCLGIKMQALEQLENLVREKGLTLS